MCGPLFALWAGRHNNGPITERTSEVRGGNVNTRIVKLQSLDKDIQSPEIKHEGEETPSRGEINNGPKISEQRYVLDRMGDRRDLPLERPC